MNARMLMVGRFRNSAALQSRIQGQGEFVGTSTPDHHITSIFPRHLLTRSIGIPIPALFTSPPIILIRLDKYSTSDVSLGPRCLGIGCK